MQTHNMAIAAEFYSRLGMGLVALDDPADPKRPRSKAWTDTKVPPEYWLQHPEHGIGCNHKFSGTGTLDVDHAQWAALAFGAMGLDLETILRQGIRSEGAAGRAKAWFRIPEGLPVHKVVWPHPTERRENGKPVAVTVIELRGAGGQDVLPPSMHPEGHPYRWVDREAAARPISQWPELPDELVRLWRDFDRNAWLNACPWYEPPEAKERLRKERKGAQGAGVIGPFNEVHSVQAILETHGYKLDPRTGKYCSPDSTTGAAGVWITPDGLRCYSHHGDELGDRESHDAFDVYRILDHDGDRTAAVREAAKALGIPFVSSVSGGSGGFGTHVRPPLSGFQDQPAPLPDVLPPVTPFDPEVLPDAFRAFVADVATRMSCPIEYPAVAVMQQFSVVVGRRLGIRLKRRDNWTIAPNLWALVVGPPGSKKTPALGDCRIFLRRLVAEAFAAHEDEMASHELAMRLHKSRTKAADQRAARELAKNPNADVMGEFDIPQPEEPVLLRYETSDPTVPALAELMRENPNGIGLFRDELMGLFKKLDAEDDGSREFYLEAANGTGSYTSDRIGRGLHLHVEAVCLSLLGGTQPGKLLEYVASAAEGGAGNDGLMQRLQLLVFPDKAKHKFVDEFPDAAAENAAGEAFEAVARLDTASAAQDTDRKGEPYGLPYLRLSDEAYQHYVDWDAVNQAKVDDEERPPVLREHLAKYPKTLGSLALLCYLADRDSEQPLGEVDDVSFSRAAGFLEILESHAGRAYAPGTRPVITAMHEITNRLKKADLPCSKAFTARDVYRHGFAYLTEPGVVRRALERLTRDGWLLAQTVDTGGRPTEIYWAHPLLEPATQKAAA